MIMPTRLRPSGIGNGERSSALSQTGTIAVTFGRAYDLTNIKCRPRHGRDGYHRLGPAPPRCSEGSGGAGDAPRKVDVSPARPTTATPVAADLDDADSLRAALSGVQSTTWSRRPPPWPRPSRSALQRSQGTAALPTGERSRP